MHSKNQKRHSSPGTSRIPLVPMKPKAPAAPVAPGPGSGDTLAFRVPKDYPHSRFNKAPLAVYPPKGARNKTCVSLPVVTLEKIPCLSRVDGTSRVRLTSSSSSPSSLRPPPSSSPLTPPTSASSHPHRSGEKLVNGRGGGGVFGGVPSSSVSGSVTPPSTQDRRPSPARSPLDRRPPSTPSTASPLDRRPPPSPSSSQRAGATPSCLQLPMPASLSSSNSGSLLDRKQQNGVKASSSSSSSSSRSHKRLSGRVFDPDKHCGVQDPESKRPCTRSLTCKTHSLTHRRAVPGRTKHFDSLLAEHKGRAKEKDTSKEKEKEDAAQQQARKDGGSSTAAMMSQETTSPSRPHCPNGRPLSTLKLRLANAHIPRVPGLISSSAALPAAPPAPAPASSSSSNPEPSPHGWGKTAGDTSRLSSDDGDVETSDDAADRPACHFSSHHPRPLACCVFSSRLMGRGHYVFDRRWDRMRLALQSMVERHLNAQMWRKVPLAAESLLSLSSSPSPYANSLTPPPPLLPSPSEPFSSFSSHAQSASSAGALAPRGPPAPVVSAAGKPRNGTANAHKPGRPAREREDSVPSAKKRRSSAVLAPSPSLSSSSSFSSSSSSSPTVDGHKRNGGSCHPALLQGRGGSAAAQGRRKGPGRGGSYPGSRGEDWLSRTDGGQSNSTQNSLEHPTATSIPHSPSKDQTISTHHPSGPLAYVGGGGVDGKKRRSPSSYGGKSSKLSRVGGLESLLRKENGTGSILASGPDSPRQAKLHH